MVARVCLVSGGTGGHLMPALVLARALRERGHEPLLVTEGRDVEREFLARDVDCVQELGPPAGRPSKLRLPWWLVQATMRARRLLRERQVDAVISTGGRPSLPVGLAARLLGKPVFLLEQNAVTGRANKWLLPFARRLWLGLPGPGSGDRRALVTGTPLRPELYAADRERARARLGLRQDQPVLLVTGGSQGASVLNERVPAALANWPAPLQVLHLAGLGRDDEVRRRYEAADGQVTAIVRPVAMDMDCMLGAADLVICRGGGTTVAELMAVGRAAIIVPYPHHKDRQQQRNGAVLERAGAALLVEEHALDAESLRAVLQALLRDDPGRLRTMEACARRLCAGDPTEAILADMLAQGGLR